MGLEDIDDDCGDAPPPPAPQPRGAAARTARPPGGGRPAGGGADLLDDLFSGIASSSTTASSSVSPRAAPAPPAPAAPAPATGCSPGSDFFDTLFTSSPAPPPAGGAWHPATSAAAAAAANDDDLLGAERGPRRQHRTRTEADLLEGFEARAKGRSWSALGGAQGPRLSEIRGSGTSYAALAANPHLQELMTYYDFLGLAPTATEAEIRAAYKAKALQLHPDKRRAKGDAVTDAEVELFKTITTAHEVLADGDRRAQYDRELQAKEAAGSANWLRHVSGA